MRTGCILIALATVVSTVSGVRLHVPSIGTAPLNHGGVHYVGNKLCDSKCAAKVAIDRDISFGDLPSRMVPVTSEEPVAAARRAVALAGDGWVNDDLKSVGASKPLQSLAEMEADATYQAPTVNDGITESIVQPEDLSPDDLNHRDKPINSYVASQDDPVTPEGVSYSIGDPAQNAALLLPKKMEHVVELDPASLTEPPSQLARPLGDPATKDIRVEVRGEDTDTLGEPVRGWEAVTQGPHDSRATRVLDPTVLRAAKARGKPLVAGADGAVDDAGKGMPSGASRFGADEHANLEVLPRPFDRTPERISRTPFREGMEDPSS